MSLTYLDELLFYRLALDVVNDGGCIATCKDGTSVGHTLDAIAVCHCETTKIRSRSF